MFSATDQSTQPAVLPPDCTFRESDWLVLADFWHPIAIARDVTEAPMSVRLLDVDLVVWRSDEGIAVARDQCPHRGARLSDGRVRAGRLVCPMHGLAFDGAGACRRIPSLADPEKGVPPKMRLGSVMAREHHGLVWACLSGRPSWPLPQWDGIGDPALEKLFMPIDTWQTSAGRHVENFNDIAHFPWVHTESFGGDEAWATPHYEVRRTDWGLAFDLPYTEGGNRFPDGVVAERRDVVYRYELTFPFSTLIKVEPQGSDFVHYFADTVSPVSAHVSRIFQVVTDTTGRPDPALWNEDARIINAEDRPLVEAQRPRDLPLDLAQEIHIPADRLSIEYRRALATRFGLGAPAAAATARRSAP